MSWFPEPWGPPKPALNIGSRVASAPPFLLRTMPVRSRTRRVLVSLMIFVECSQSLARRLRKPLVSVRGDSSVDGLPDIGL